jgi:hypothetical protein
MINKITFFPPCALILCVIHTDISYLGALLTFVLLVTTRIFRAVLAVYPPLALAEVPLPIGLLSFVRILYIHSQALIVQDGPLACLFGVLDHTHTDTR